FADLNLDGRLDLIAVNGHIDDTVRNVQRDVPYAQPPLLFLNEGSARFRDIAAEVGGGFATPKVARGLAYGDFDRDGDADVLLTTNDGPAYLFRNDQAAGNRSIRFELVGTKSNRDAIGSKVRIYSGDLGQLRTIRSGSSYCSQSELAAVFGVGRRDKVDRVAIEWPSGRTEEYRNLQTGKAYRCTEGKGISEITA
ncbi:MAG TPA: CRTAC1 family protein, partial [Terriglobales bacterium]|nr:CRTAC1 family protein [Terriglobales bacterium]